MKPTLTCFTTWHFRITAWRPITSPREPWRKPEFTSAQGKKFLEKLFELDPEWGEPYAIYATLLGLEIALNPNEAMTIAFEIGDYFGIGLLH